MQIEYQLTFNDYRESLAAQQVKSLPLKVMVALGVGVFYVFAVVVLMSFGLNQARSSVCIIFSTLVLGVAYRLLWRGWLRRDFHRHPRLMIETRARIDDTGVHFESEVGTSHMKWIAYTKFQETQHLFMLYLGARLVHVLPKRAFSGEHLDEFRRLVRTNLRVTENLDQKGTHVELHI